MTMMKMCPHCGQYLPGEDQRLAERVDAIRSARNEGLTYDHIGQVHGISRERVRQILRDSGGDPKPQVQRTKEREARKAWAEFIARLACAYPCRVCLYWNVRGGSTCSEECAGLWSRLRRVLDVKAFETHRLACSPHLQGVPPRRRYMLSHSLRADLRKVARLRGGDPRIVELLRR
jgi:sigma-70-like protein